MINKLKKIKDNFFVSKRVLESYSQCGEDIIIQYIFNLRGISFPSYIDIGANDPYFISNTAIFYKKGCKGINIEANPMLIDKFNRYRPNDLNLNIGIGEMETEQELYIMNDNTLSSFSFDECEKYISTGKYKIIEKIKVKILTFEQVIKKYCNDKCPDFLSLDVEGMDFSILKSIDFVKYRPKVICVEAAEYSPIGAGDKRLELIDYLISLNYFEYANTNLNAIMVDQDFWKNV